MIRFDDLALFVRTATAGSFSKAAREVDLLPGQVSAAIKRLERDLEIRLFARSTRSLRLTAEGEQYLPYAQQVLDTLEEGQQRLHPQKTELRGTLRISTSSDFGRNQLLPWLMAFQQQHPALNLRLCLSDQLSDVFRDPVDVAIRYGKMPDASYIALPLAPDNRRVLVAAPSYLQRHGHPQSLEALREHQCLQFLIRGRPHDRWSLHIGGQWQQVKVSGSLVSDDADVVRRLAIAGAGIAYKAWLDVAEDIQAGRLVQLRPDWLGEALPLYLVCPHRQQLSTAARALYALIQQECQRLMAAYPGLPFVD